MWERERDRKQREWKSLISFWCRYLQCVGTCAGYETLVLGLFVKLKSKVVRVHRLEWFYIFLHLEWLGKKSSWTKAFSCSHIGVPMGGSIKTLHGRPCECVFLCMHFWVRVCGVCARAWWAVQPGLELLRGWSSLVSSLGLQWTLHQPAPSDIDVCSCVKQPATHLHTFYSWENPDREHITRFHQIHVHCVTAPPRQR